MKIKNYLRFKGIAKTTAIVLLSTVALTGCASGENEIYDEDDEDLFIMSHGVYVPYNSYKSKNGVIDSNTKFFTRSGNGYTTYKPSSSEITSMQKGSFSGKASRPTIKSSTPTKSFGGSSSRSATGG